MCIMTRDSLQMVLLCSLLLVFTGRTCPRCINEDGLNKLIEELQTRYWDKKVSVSPPDNRTCMQAAREMRGADNNRAVSPWKYRIDQDNDRIPPKIPFAVCICEGCIIHQREDMDYNSKAVYASLMIHRRTGKCSDNKYKVKKDFIQVPVGCTCVVPNIS
ncbi:interleukin-17C-like [Pagrus major]|uniref:interleukin-17C-like n=1 Tax=Pagrus major TaxID=143350 RepID=UPI003CC83F03